MDRPLTLLERLRLRMHILICPACTRFDRQMDFLRQAMRKMPPDSIKGKDAP